MRLSPSTRATSPSRARAVVDGAAGLQRLGVRVRVDLHCAPVLEPDAQARDERAGDVERLRRGHDSARPLGIGRRVDLLGRDVRHVPHAGARLRRAALLREARARQQADREVGARSVEVQRVEVERVEPARDLPDLVDALVPRPRRVGLVEAADVDRRPARAARAPRPASPPGRRPGPTSRVGKGESVHAIDRSSIVLNVSFTVGSRSRPARAGSTPSSRPGGTSGTRTTRAASSSPRPDDPLPEPRRHPLERVVRRPLGPDPLQPPGRSRTPPRTAHRGRTPPGRSRPRAAAPRAAPRSTSTWSGCTLAPTETIRSAYRSSRFASIRRTRYCGARHAPL